MTDAQFSLLNKGLTFIPTFNLFQNQKRQIQYDLQSYHRRIKLAIHFDGEDGGPPLPFLPPSDWTPDDKQLPEVVSHLIHQDLLHLRQLPKFQSEKHNLNSDEVLALKQLMNNKNIVLKPADKGSAVVIMSRDQYLWEAYNQLNNSNYYTKLSKPIYLDTVPMIKKILDTLKDKKFINHKQHTYLKGNPTIRPRRFYLLPKIHKDPDKWSVPHLIPPGRPIVSDCDSESYKTAEFVDYFLTPISNKHKSYVKDTYDFIDKIKQAVIPSTAYLFTMDIESLYTNIETETGLQAVKALFHKHPDRKRPEKEILQLLEINLTRNDFEFNSEFFLQIKGTAMGKKFAPAYANIFMAVWEDEALAKCHKKPLHYVRYIDDIFGIWPHTTQDFLEFANILNTHHRSIKLKFQLDQDSINFLDTTVYKGPTFHQTGKLDIKVYFKDTDTHALLHKNSFHPKHTFKGLVKSQLLRFHRICTQKTDFLHASKVLFTALRDRGYSRPFLRKCYKTFLDTTPILVHSIIPCVTTFSSMSVNLNRKIKNNFETIVHSNGFLQDHKVISAQRRNKNLRDYLVHAKLKPFFTKKPQDYGEFFQRTKLVCDSQKQKWFTTQQGISPKTQNCVYLIWCSKCQLKYVGETGNTITTRMTQHRYNIKNKKQTDTPLVQHFLLHGWEAFKCTGIKHNPNWTIIERRREEKRWILKLNTMQPRGLNERWN